jgi:hypothetical protein
VFAVFPPAIRFGLGMTIRAKESQIFQSVVAANSVLMVKLQLYRTASPFYKPAFGAGIGPAHSPHSSDESVAASLWRIRDEHAAVRPRIPPRDLRDDCVGFFRLAAGPAHSTKVAGVYPEPAKVALYQSVIAARGTQPKLGQDLAD